MHVLCKKYIVGDINEVAKKSLIRTVEQIIVFSLPDSDKQ
jgi:hypothetical protein